MIFLANSVRFYVDSVKINLHVKQRLVIKRRNGLLLEWRSVKKKIGEMIFGKISESRQSHSESKFYSFNSTFSHRNQCFISLFVLLNPVDCSAQSLSLMCPVLIKNLKSALKIIIKVCFISTN
jgi:hypothetical protein